MYSPVIPVWSHADVDPPRRHDGICVVTRLRYSQTFYDGLHNCRYKALLELRYSSSLLAGGLFAERDGGTFLYSLQVVWGNVGGPAYLLDSCGGGGICGTPESSTFRCSPTRGTAGNYSERKITAIASQSGSFTLGCYN